MSVEQIIQNNIRYWGINDVTFIFGDRSIRNGALRQLNPETSLDILGFSSSKNTAYRGNLLF